MGAVLEGPKYVFDLLPTGGSMRARCPRCEQEASFGGLVPESGAPAAAFESLWKCERCSKVVIAVPPVRRVVALIMLGTFACVPLAVLVAATWFVRGLVAEQVPDSGGIITALVLAAAGAGYVLWRILRSMRGLLRRTALVPVNYDSVRRRWIIEGRL